MKLLHEAKPGLIALGLKKDKKTHMEKDFGTLIGLCPHNKYPRLCWAMSFR